MPSTPLKVYVVYEGRGNMEWFDEHDASVLETIGILPEMVAKRRFRRNWKKTNSVLYSYDRDPNNPDNLRNGTFVESVPSTK